MGPSKALLEWRESFTCLLFLNFHVEPSALNSSPETNQEFHPRGLASKAKFLPARRTVTNLPMSTPSHMTVMGFIFAVGVAKLSTSVNALGGCTRQKFVQECVTPAYKLRMQNFNCGIRTI